MKILQVIHSTNPSAGGVIEAVKQISLNLIKKGISVEIACLDSPKNKWVNELPIKIHALGPGLGKYSYSVTFLNWCKNNLNKYDCVIINGVWQFHSYAVWKTLKNSKVPYFVFPHGMLDPWFKKKYPLKHVKKQIYWLIAENKVLRDAKSVIFTAEEERLLAKQSFFPYRCNEIVVNLGIEKPKGDKDQQKIIFIKQFPELKNKKIILFLGRIHEKKGCDLLIQAFATIANKDKNLHLVIAGPDQTGSKNKLEQLSLKLGVQNKITWTGMLSGDMKWGAFLSSEAFILPSHQENFGIAVAEALALGVPVLISNKINIWREIQNEKAGLIENDDLTGTISLLRQWIEMTKKEKKKMSINAVECFKNNFRIESCADKIISLI